MADIVVAAGFGGPEVLELRSADVADPGPGQVRLAVRSAAVNPIDHKRYSGMFGTNAAELPMRLGQEVAGVVAAAGPGAGFAVGDEVIAYSVDGGYASELLVDAEVLSPKPAGASFDEAAGLLLAGTTAAHLVEATRVGDGDVVLIHGAAGAVGALAVQLAMARGARVVGTASAGRHDFLRGLGAEPVTYGDGLADRVTDLGAPTVALDTVGTDEALDVSLRLVSDRTRIATVANFDRAVDEGIQVLGGGPGADPGTEIRTAARPGLLAALADGTLRVEVGPSFPLAQVADAHRLSIDGHAAGKIVLRP